MIKEIDEELVLMSGLGQGLVELGIEIGRERGIKEVELQNTLDHLKNVMQNLKCSLDYAFKVLDILEEEQQQYVELLNKKQ